MVEQAVVRNIAGVADVAAERQDGVEPLVILARHVFLVERGQVGGDGGLQLVQRAVELACLHHAVPVVALETGAGIQQQGLQHVGHAQCLARGVAQRDGRHVMGPFVQVLRPRRVVGIGALKQPARQQRGVRRENGQENQRDHDVEQGV